MATMVARGPDGAGTWASNERGPVLGHRRLAVIDASAAGIQPMSDHSGRWTITLNGEIYNHLDLRKARIRSELMEWRGHSDTETLVECIREWELIETLHATSHRRWTSCAARPEHLSACALRSALHWDAGNLEQGSVSRSGAKRIAPWRESIVGHGRV